MQSGGEYIAERLLPQFVRAACRNLGIQCQSLSDDWVLQLGNVTARRHVVGYKFDINQAASGSLAADKVAAYQVLQARNIPSIEHRLFRRKEMPAVSEIHNGVVVKPLMGTGGRQVEYFAQPEEAHVYMQNSDVEAWAVSPYVKITQEIRTIVLDGNPLLMYEKIPPTQDGELVFFNLGKGAAPRDIPVDDNKAIATLAIEAQRALGLRVAAVDCVCTEDGSAYVLEVNDGIMMEYYARSSPERHVHAQEIYRQIVGAMMNT